MATAQEANAHLENRFESPRRRSCNLLGGGMSTSVIKERRASRPASAYSSPSPPPVLMQGKRG